MISAYGDLPKGIAWEYRVMRAGFLAGWYVRRGINLRERVRNSPQTLAEIDIFGVGFDPALTPRTLVGECKDRKSGTKEADRIVWVLGLSKLLKVDHVLFAKSTLSDATVQFAQPAGFLLWDEAAVLAVEQRFGLNAAEGYFGSANIALSEDVLKPARTSGAIANRGLRAAWEYLSGAFWYHPTPARTKSLAGYFGALQNASGLSEQARSGFVAEGLIALLVAAYTSAGQLTRLSPGRAEVRQETMFASGAADAQALRELAARADDYYQDALRRVARTAGAGTTDVKVPRLANTIADAPRWMKSYLVLAQRLSEHPSIAGDSIRYADVLLFEHLLAGNEMPEVLRDMIPCDHTVLQSVVQVVGLFAQRVWGVDDPLIDRLLKLTPVKPRRKRSQAQMVAREARLFEDPDPERPPGH